ncbi:SLAC1 anion channel family protein [Pseudothauera rhizosphaerae]|uniref:C4-dicarboxylate ABC transporter n=1 Tax=Pseudothauera rhizosphaerae TaxID=2565932 RepID=A0A4S4AVV1_9RHOO|nr:SLAC1 anion channel family protein [Pseudothauera rhizosphaerae]THF63345.1 C4-dicarboxylate ABC transporter [Pseudothauera rhizosphaerae]
MSQSTSAPAAAGSHSESRLAHFPVALFSTVMGVAGLTLAWLKAHHAVGVPAGIGEALRWAATGLFVFLLAVYGFKILRHPAAVAAERAHPVKLNFFPAISIGLLLLAIAWVPQAPGAARWTWYVGAAVHLGFTLWTMSSWIHHTHYDIKHANPAWFIPVVGNILVPIAGVKVAPMDLSWFFFSIGLVFWLVLMTIVLYRLFFHEPLPARLTPTLFILIAPPAVGFISYVALTGVVDAFARVLYFVALFLTLLLASNALRFFRLPFFISAWAYSFPLAAMTIATFEMAAHGGGAFYGGLGWVLLAVLSAVVLALVVKTLLEARAGRICVPE